MTPDQKANLKELARIVAHPHATLTEHDFLRAAAFQMVSDPESLDLDENDRIQVQRLLRECGHE